MPHSPQAWLKRSYLLLALGFPKLGAADAYKAIMLCNAGLDCKYQSARGEYVRLIVGLTHCFFKNPGNMEMLTRSRWGFQLMSLSGGWEMQVK